MPRFCHNNEKGHNNIRNPKPPSRQLQYLQQMNSENSPLVSETITQQLASPPADNYVVPVCEDGSLEVTSPRIQLIPTNAIDQEISLQTEISGLQNHEMTPLRRGSIDLGREDNINFQLPNLDSLFEGLDFAMEQFWQENNRSISLLRMYVNNLNRQLKPFESRKIELKSRKIRCSGKECSICFNGIRKNSKVPMLKCKHKFHKKCLAQWVEQKPNCPLCRHSIE